jgi:phosphate butyryltransferase
MPMSRLDQILEAVKSKPKKRLVAAWAVDAHTIEAVNAAREKGIIDATLVGDEAQIRKVLADLKLDEGNFEIIHEATDTGAGTKAVERVRSGHGQILMKGLLSTDKYMRAILDKEKGLMRPGAVLSHVTVIENVHYPKLIICGDVAVLPYPDLKQKIAITNYVIQVGHALGIAKPKVALICATEQVSEGIEATVHAAVISKMADRGQIKDAFVDGPMALDVAIDRESAETKGVKGEVPGDADALVFPNIDAGNVFYKTNTKLGGCELAAMVVGATAPCVLSSRGDTAQTKLYSIALAALSAR